MHKNQLFDFLHICFALEKFEFSRQKTFRIFAIILPIKKN